MDPLGQKVIKERLRLTLEELFERDDLEVHHASSEPVVKIITRGFGTPYREEEVGHDFHVSFSKKKPEKK
jgi:hypothetical protein